jgi:hypothetical protein
MFEYERGDLMVQEKKGLIAKLLDNADKKLEKKSKAKGCCACGCGSEDKGCC